jgi:cell division protein FtsB
MGAQLMALVLVLGLVSAMAIQPTRQLLAQQHRISATAHELHRTEKDNHRLDVQIARLQNPDYIEEQARAQIGLVRPGETAYVVMPKPHKHLKIGEHHAKAPRTERKSRKPAPRSEGVIRGFLNFLGF